MNRPRCEHLGGMFLDQCHTCTPSEAERARAVMQRGTDKTRAADLTFRSLADVAAEVDAEPPPSWLFEPVIVAGDYGVMSAEDKSGKTWAVTDAAVSCGAGLPWLGQYRSGTPGPVVVFFGEGSRRKVVRRIRAVAVSKGLTREQADALPIVLCFRAPKLSSALQLEEIRQAIAEHRPRLVIIDPLYLAAGGANGADLYAMGDLLGGIQRIVQEAGASLLIAHHWNKGGTGDGHNRSSGVGPGAWGRFLISVAVKSARTDPETKETTVRLKWMFKGDETPDSEITIIRRVRAEVPADLSSPMHYSIERANDGHDGQEDDGLTPAERKLLEALQSGRREMTVREIGDRIAERHGTGLRRETCSRGLNRLAQLGLVDQIAGKGFGAPDQWLATEESAGQHSCDPL